MKNIFNEIIECSIKNGLDPIGQIMDYLLEKDSHITRMEAEAIVAKYQNEQPVWTVEEILRREG